MLFQLETHAKFPLCAATFLTCSDFWFLHQMNAAPPHESSLQTARRCYLQWRGLLLPVFKHELGSLRFGAVWRERWHNKLVIAALWGFFLHRHQKRELNCRVNVNGQEPSDILMARTKLKMLGLGLNSKNIFLGLFIRAPFISWLFQSTSFSLLLAQFIPWGRVCTVGKYDEWMNSHSCA